MQRFVILIWIILGLIAFISSCGNNTDITVTFEMERMLEKADRLKEQMLLKGPVFSDEDFNTLVEAYTAVTQIIQSPVDDAEVQSASKKKRAAWALASLAKVRIGTLYLDRGLFDEAFGYFKSVADNPATTENQKSLVIKRMAFIREKSKRYEEAAALYDSLAVRYKNMIIPGAPDFDVLNAPIKNAQMWRKAGSSKKFNEQMDEARAYYNELINKYTGTPMEHAAFGKLIATYIQQERFTEAVELMKSLRDDSTGLIPPNLLMMIADIYLKNLRDFKSAEKTFREFIASYPEHKRVGNAYLGLGLGLFKQKRFAEARKTVRDIERTPGIDEDIVAEAFYLRALCFDKEDRWEMVIGQFDLLQATFPGSAKSFEAALYVANRYHDEGEKELARKYFKEAEDYMRKFSGPDITDPALASRALYYLARCYSDQRDFEKSAEALIELYNRYPQLPEGKLAPFKLSKLYENAFFDTTRAVFWLKAFVTNNPDAENLEEVLAKIQLLESP